MTFTYWFFCNLSRLIARVFFRLRVVHPERMIESGPLLLASNHVSYFDPPLVGMCSRRAVYYLARKTLMDWPVFGRMFPDMNVIPVDRDGADMTALKTLIRIVRAGNGAVVFPEGTRSLDGHLQAGQAGIGFLIAKTLAPVLPVRIFGAHEAFPKHARFPRPRRITVVIGEPIRFTKEEVASGDREAYRLLSQRVMDAIAALRIP